MSQVEESHERLGPLSELTKLQLRVAALAAMVMILGGLTALAAGPIEEALATLRQHDRSAEGDARITRYANAMAGAYDILVDDFEDALVAFEFGALPTTVSGEVIGFPHPTPAALPGPVELAEVGPVTTITALRDDGPANGLPDGSLIFGGGVIRIPAIDLNQSVGEGVGREHLRLGPGHYPGTALPGATGNVVISGHRTTYSKPFHDLDLVSPGDAIFIDTPEATFRYVVADTLVVSADDAGPLRNTDQARLTLTTCHPKGSARERLVVVAYLDEGAIRAFGS